MPLRPDGIFEIYGSGSSDCGKINNIRSRCNVRLGIPHRTNHFQTSFFIQTSPRTIQYFKVQLHRPQTYSPTECAVYSKARFGPRRRQPVQRNTDAFSSAYPPPTRGVLPKQQHVTQCYQSPWQPCRAAPAGRNGVCVCVSVRAWVWYDRYGSARGEG